MILPEKFNEYKCFLHDINHEISKFPNKQSAVIQSLVIIQEKKHYISQFDIDFLSFYLEMEPIKIYEVASFYKHITLKKTNKSPIKVCNSISCYLKGSNKMIQFLKQNIKNADIQHTECLAACTKAPAAYYKSRYYENLTGDKLKQFCKLVNEDSNS